MGKRSIFADSLKHADYAKHNLLRLLAESINPPRIFNLSLEDLSLLFIAIRTQEKSFHYYYETFFLLLAPFLWGRKFATSKRDGAKKKFHLNAKPFFRGRIRFEALGRDLQSVALEARAGGVVQSGYEAFGDMNQIPRKSGGIPASRWICDSHLLRRLDWSWFCGIKGSRSPEQFKFLMCQQRRARANVSGFGGVEINIKFCCSAVF